MLGHVESAQEVSSARLKLCEFAVSPIAYENDWMKVGSMLTLAMLHGNRIMRVKGIDDVPVL